MLKNQTKGMSRNLRLLSLLSGVTLAVVLLVVFYLGVSAQAFAAFSSDSVEKVIGVGRIQSSAVAESAPAPEARFAVETLAPSPEPAETNVLATPLDRNVVEEVARRIAEQTAAATEAAAKVAEESNSIAQPALLPAPFTPVGDLPTGNNQDQPKQKFVNEWSPRIEAYLAGSPLEGYGFVFANAAYDYNVDPRWSPAISCLESSKGRYCFSSFNAWGWGQAGWSDWETAIYAHIKGLSMGYGYSVTVAAAQAYCPTNAQHWFSVVSSEMAQI